MSEHNPADPETNVSSAFPFSLQYVNILDAEMAYLDTDGPSGKASDLTAVFIHGNPTSSYLWRNIIPHVSDQVRCVAPDLVGMGASSKPYIKYKFVEHANYLDNFLDAIVPNGKIVLLIQDWGSAFGFDWAFRHQNRVAGLVFMEFIRPFPTWDDAAQGAAQETFKAFRSGEVGRKLIIDQNTFIETMLPRGLVRSLSPDEKEYYAKPYQKPESRLPLFMWPNEIPIEGHPEDVHNRATAYHTWLLETDLPKLFFWATPGRIVTSEKARWYLDHLKNVKGVFVGKGMHFLQEDHPHRIGSEMSAWLEVITL
jgi:haloalkane dehalogenase